MIQFTVVDKTDDRYVTLNYYDKEDQQRRSNAFMQHRFNMLHKTKQEVGSYVREYLFGLTWAFTDVDCIWSDEGYLHNAKFWGAVAETTEESKSRPADILIYFVDGVSKLVA